MPSNKQKIAKEKWATIAGYSLIPLIPFFLITLLWKKCDWEVKKCDWKFMGLVIWAQFFDYSTEKFIA